MNTVTDGAAMPDAAFYEIGKVDKSRALLGKRYIEFLRVAAMSAGLYVLPAAGSDPQSPHKEDEMYYIVKGKARMRAESEDREVGTGSVIFVAAGVEHRFHSIEEDLLVLVFFAPAES